MLANNAKRTLYSLISTTRIDEAVPTLLALRLVTDHVHCASEHSIRVEVGETLDRKRGRERGQDQDQHCGKEHERLFENHERLIYGS